MAPEGIKLPGDSTVASQKVRRSTSAPLENPESAPKKATQAPTPNPLATVVLQSKPIIEGRKGELFQLLLQNDPKSAPPIKLYADTNISPGTPLLLELDEKGQYQPVDSPSRTQLGALIKLELEFWQAHLFPKAAIKPAPSLPATETLIALAKQFPQLKPLIQWLVQRPSQLNSQIIHQWFQENSPLSSLREFSNVKSTHQFNLAQNTSQTGQINSSLAALTANNQAARQAGPESIAATLTRAHSPEHNSKAGSLNTTSNLGSANSHQTATPASSPANVLSPTQAFLKFAFASRPNGQVGVQPSHSQNDSKSLPSQFTESTVAAAIRSKQWAPNLGLLPTISAKVLSTYITEQSQVHKSVLLTNTNVDKPISAPQSIIGTNNTNAAQVSSLPPTPTAGIQPTTMDSIKQITNELFNFTQTKSNQAQQTSSNTANNLIEVKLGQWLALIEQTQAKDSSDLAHLLKSKAMGVLSGQAEFGEKIQSDVKLQLPLSQPDKENALNQLRSWMETAQAKVLHQAVQATSAQWQAPDLPVIQQMQLPLIWLGLTSWADIEWWQEKKKNQADEESEAESKRRWRMRIYLNVDPLAEFCADIDWHPSDTHLTFWSEDSATLSHLNTLVPTLKEWTLGLSNESLIQTRHGMPKRASDQQLKRTNHHLVDVKT